VRAFAVAVAFLSFVVLAGCRQDMHNQPKFIPLRESEFFPDGRSERPLVPGTVPRGELRENTPYYTGLVGDNIVDTLPMPVSKDVLKRGQERFNIYCAPCHSMLGDGDGEIVRRGYLRPPSFHDDRLRNAPVGHFYRVMTYGSGAMPDYAEQIEPADRWAIVAYIRALQLSQAAPVSDVPANERPKLGNPPPPIDIITGKTGPKGMEPPIQVTAPKEGVKNK
jgi:hypothetical protein